jgi:hypothetical protein
MVDILEVSEIFRKHSNEPAAWNLGMGEIRFTSTLQVGIDLCLD